MRYTELANSLVKNIADGDYAVGEQLPCELDLASHYGVSRSTVRSALDIVERLGLVSRKRRAGTVVTAARPANAYSKSVQTLEDLVAYASHTAREVVSVGPVVADEALAQVIECKPGTRWLRFRTLRTENDAARTPLCWNDAYVEPALGQAIAPLVKDGSGLLSQLIEQQTGVTVSDIKQTLGAIAMPTEMGARLGAPAGTPALEITRLYLDGAGRTFLATVNTYPQDKFRFTLWMHRGEPGAS